MTIFVTIFNFIQKVWVVADQKSSSPTLVPVKKARLWTASAPQSWVWTTQCGGFNISSIQYNMWVMCVWPSLCYNQWARDQPFRTRTQLTAGKMSTKASWWHVRGLKRQCQEKSTTFFIWLTNSSWASYEQAITNSRNFWVREHIREFVHVVSDTVLIRVIFR